MLKCFKILIRALTSPLHDLPGPPSDSVLLGNLRAMMREEHAEVHEQWVQEYGHTIGIPALFGVRFGDSLSLPFPDIQHL